MSLWLWGKPYVFMLPRIWGSLHRALYTTHPQWVRHFFILLGIPSTTRFFAESREIEIMSMSRFLLGIPSRCRDNCPTRVFSELADVHMDHAIGPARRKGAVRNNDRRYVFQETIELSQQPLFGEFIKRGSALVENQDPGTLQ